MNTPQPLSSLSSSLRCLRGALALGATLAVTGCGAPVEDDASTSEPILAEALPDLFIAPQLFTASCLRGTITVNVRVVNPGPVGAGMSHTGISITPLGPRPAVATPPIGSVGGYSFTQSYGGFAPGWHAVTARADVFNVVAESNEANNARTINILCP